MRGARSQKCTIDGVQFDSIAEACLYCWCKEAKELGVISKFCLQPQYHLYDKVDYKLEKQLKTKMKVVSRSLLQACNYTADFYVHAPREIKGLLIPQEVYNYTPPEPYPELRYVIDVKGAFNKAASEFSLYQKILWHEKGLYVNKVVIAYDQKKYSAKKCSQGFFANNGVPSKLPDECYQKNGVDMYAIWNRMFSGLPSIKEVYKE